MGSTASLKHQDTGSIPSLAQWVKGSGVGRSSGSDQVLGLGTPYAMEQPKKKKRKGFYVWRATLPVNPKGA